MAKRFTDTDKWKREWFCELNYKAKLVWFYLLDQCDHRGVWYKNFKLLSSSVGFKVKESDFNTWFNNKVIRLDSDKFLIPSFIVFQYKSLNYENKAHKGIIELIQNIGVDDEQLRGLIAPSKESLEGAKDKDKDKDKEQEQDKEKVKVKEEIVVVAKNQNEAERSKHEANTKQNEANTKQNEANEPSISNSISISNIVVVENELEEKEQQQKGLASKEEETNSGKVRELKQINGSGTSVARFHAQFNPLKETIVSNFDNYFKSHFGVPTPIGIKNQINNLLTKNNEEIRWVLENIQQIVIKKQSFPTSLDAERYLKTTISNLLKEVDSVAT